MRYTLHKELTRLIPNTGITSIHGLYYMRFELGGEGNYDRLKRIEQATRRGCEIYRKLIGDDEVVIAIEEWESDFHDAKNLNKPYVRNILQGVDLKRNNGPFEQIYYEKDENGVKHEKVFHEPLECDLLIGKAHVNQNQVECIIRGIASLEMGEEPCIPQNVYFFSIAKQAGFRIYDDRGCDIWANSIEVLRHIYHDLNDWILDYNRPEIDNMFE